MKQIEHLQQEIQNLDAENRKDKQELVCVLRNVLFKLNSLFVVKMADCARQRRQLEERLTRKENELETIRHELNQVKEFRKKKGQMQKELDEVNFIHF